MYISIKVSLKFVPKGPINNIAALFQIMAWRRPGDKPLSEPRMVQFIDASMRHSASNCSVYNRPIVLYHKVKLFGIVVSLRRHEIEGIIEYFAVASWRLILTQ